MLMCLMRLMLCDGCRERQDALSSAQESLAQLLQSDPPHAYTAYKAHVVAALDDLLAAAQAASSKQAAVSAIASTLATASVGSLKRQNDSAGCVRGQGNSTMARRPSQQLLLLGGGGGCSDVSWVLGVMTKLRELLLETDRQVHQLFWLTGIDLPKHQRPCNTLCKRFIAVVMDPGYHQHTGRVCFAEAAASECACNTAWRLVHGAVGTLELPVGHVRLLVPGGPW
jgi:hypothetical protein